MNKSLFLINASAFKKGNGVSGQSADSAIAALYTAAAAPDQWDAALEALRRLADARAANCFVHDGLTDSFLEYRYTGYGPNWADGYASHYHNLDLARQVLLREPAGQMYPMHRYVTQGMVERSEYYQDFYIAEGLRYSCGGTSFDGNQRLILAVHRPVGHCPYDEHTVSELQRVLNHLPSVFRVRELTMQTSQQALMSSAALDALPRAVLIVDECMSVRYVNAAANALLERSVDVLVRANRLTLADPPLARQLAQRIRHACAATPVIAPVPLYVAGLSSRPSLELQIMPLKPQLAASVTSAKPMALVALRQPFCRAQWHLSSDRPFALTQAEMAVVGALVEGLTPAEYAMHNGVKISTVRSQIKAIMAKSGTRRVTEIATLFVGIG
ncbi:helix-turn-helix transcriptional regulator [Paraburkholderia sp.]|uniref:helix-turn-helix transcriptional regulator n=1 Tax=Paraburkholderia sp. TaxID=1926495 RepID=UPI003D7019A5